MDTLVKLFGSVARLRLMRLFLFNPQETYRVDDVVSRVRTQVAVVRRELAYLERAGLIKRKGLIQKTARGTKKEVVAWTLNKAFPYIEELQTLIGGEKLIASLDIPGILSGNGRIKLIAVAGVFLQLEGSAADLIVVGDYIKKEKLEKAVKALEADIGTEIQYALFDTTDFEYRRSVHDRLVRDILDSPHQLLINKLHLR